MLQSFAICLICLFALLPHKIDAGRLPFPARTSLISRQAVAETTLWQAAVWKGRRDDISSVKALGLVLLATPSDRPSRRHVLGKSAAIVAASPYWRQVARADVSSGAPIAVLGASGRTGSLCVNACLQRGLAVRALTRSGAPPSGVDANSPLLSIMKCDVRDVSSLTAGVTGCSGVIYAASASKDGGNAEAIDNVGAVSAAEACISAKVPRFALISSTAVTRPASLGYKFTNTFVPGYARGIMDQKLLGEEGVRRIYEQDTSDCSYIIVRPGGLEETSIVEGVAGLEVSQGDVLAGVISRPDLADFMVELLRSDSIKFDTAMEVYTTKSAQPCEGRFKSFMDDERVARLHGSTWNELLARTKANGEFYVPA